MVNIDTAVTPARVVAVSLVDELALVVASCSSLGAALLATAHFGVVIGVVIGAALFAATIALTVRLADAANFTARIASRLLPRSLAERLTRLAATRLTWGQAAVLVVGYVLVHAAGGFSFWLLASGITGIGGDRLPLLAGAFNVAVVVGILAVFVPAGIGVREGVAAALAVSALSLKDATAAAVFVRLLGLAADVGFAGLADLAAGLSLRFGSS
jgi:hypothetical protein